MTLLTWAARLLIFGFLVAFSLRNTDPVSLNFVLDHSWQAPLVVVLLVFFAGGALMGVISMSGLMFRQRREIARLKRLCDGRANDTVELPPPVL